MRIKLILIGVILGLILALYPAGFAVSLAFILSALIVSKLLKNYQSRKTILILFICAFLIRAFLCFVNYNVGRITLYKGADTQPDAIIYNGNAVYLTGVLTGKSYSDEIAKEPFLENSLKVAKNTYKNKLPGFIYQYSPYVYLVSYFYSWLGYAPIALKMLNSLFGSLSIILVFLISMELYNNERSARLAAFLLAFFPSIAFWSVTSLRDPLVSFLLLLFFLSTIKYFKTQKWQFLIQIILLSFIISLIKIKIAPIFAFSLLLIIFFALFKLLSKLSSKRVLTVFTALIFILLISFFSGRIQKHSHNLANKIVNYHIKTVENLPPKVAYKIYPEYVYAQGSINKNDVFGPTMILSTIKAYFYYFLSPFPWGYWSLGTLLFYPQIMLLFLLLPFIALGIIRLFRINAFLCFSLLALLFTMTTPQVLAQGVYGTVLRHRDMLLPIFFVFATHAIAINFKSRAIK